MLYFAYGSNMSLRRLQARVASARVHGVARLHGHRLAFHKRGRDGSAKCDASRCTTPGVVFGVVYEIDAAHRPLLDAHEGVGRGYRRETVTVELLDGRPAEAFLYRATAIDASLKPFSWYRQHVLHGAREHALPNAYIAMIDAVETIADPDREREGRELAIYR